MQGAALAQLVQRATTRTGQERIPIGKHGRAGAVQASPDSSPERKTGLLKGKLTVPDSFDEPLPRDILQAMGVK